MTRPSSARLERLLSVVTRVEPGEGVTALLLTLNVFLLLTAYYVIKPVREALILAMDSGAEYKSYMGGAIAVTLLLVVPMYARLVDKWQRNRLIVSVTLFFISHLVLFYLGSLIPAVKSHLGLVFFLWVGVFNMMVVAQFWAFANDLYTEEQGKRLFALIGVGAAAGAAAGGLVATLLTPLLGVFQMLLVSAVLLALCAGITELVHAREKGGREKPKPEKERDRSGAYAMVRAHRYLMLLALFSVVFTLVNTNGEYMLGKLVKAAAEDAVRSHEITQAGIGTFIAAEFGRFYTLVNTLGLVLQLFVVSRVVKYGGLRLAFFIFPCIALLDATAVAILPLLSVLRVGKVCENATDYSLNNTVRNMLWLPTTTEMKYKAKQAVDTFFVRMGDVGSSVLVAVLAGGLGFGVRAFAFTNLFFVAAWLLLARAIVSENAKLSSGQARAPARDAARGSPPDSLSLTEGANA